MVKTDTMVDNGNILHDLQQQFGHDAIRQQQTVDEIFTIWISANSIKPAIQYLKSINLATSYLLVILVAISTKQQLSPK